MRYGDELRRPLLTGPQLGQSKKICIVGGGLSGLTIAYRIASKRPDVEIEILEKSERYGGTIETWSEGDWLCDVAVNAARAHPAFWRLIDDLGLQGVFSESNPKARSRWIHSNGKTAKLSLLMALRMGPLRLFRSIRASRAGGQSVAQIIPNRSVADAMTLGIVNHVSQHVDADFLMPSLTKYGQEPPLKWSKIKKMMGETYPLFKPRKGAIASLNGGMEVLVHALVKQLNGLENVTLNLRSTVESPEQVSNDRNIPIDSIIWCAPLGRSPEQFTSLDIYAVGYSSQDILDVPVGYGTLIPEPEIPISGILNESDVHRSARAPPNHRLFRIMAPHDRGGDEESVRECLKNILTEVEPVLFKKIGQRRIPVYEPGYMSAIESSNVKYSRAGWFYSGVSVTHVVAEAERIADQF